MQEVSATFRYQKFLHYHNNHLGMHRNRKRVVWGRWTRAVGVLLQQIQRCVWESLMTDDVGARPNGGVGDRASARLVSFNQDNEMLLGSEQAGRFRPPDRPRLT
jgi:hypothetical protein